MNTMIRLDHNMIANLASRFCILTTDEPRQAIIDSLGMHPVNHACFSRCITKDHPHNWQVYLDLTRGM